MRDDAALLENAIAVACRAHYGQRYPSPEREPYIQHPMRVMLAVRSFRVQTVAVLHDVLEDTAVTVADLRDAGFPEETVAAVVAMTHQPENTYEEYIEQVAANPVARMVKLADLADNLANNRRLRPAADVVDRIGRYERALARLHA
jgi:(p)ppGpp synthase/HD superfamily hydrolase